MSNDINTLFTKAFDKAIAIDFNKDWSNGTGYFDHAVVGEHAPKVGNGKMVKAVTPTGRRILIVGTRIGNAVIFDRYSDRQDVFVHNMPTSLKHGFVVDDGVICYELMEELIGDGMSIRNIGDRLDDLYAAIKRATPV